MRSDQAGYAPYLDIFLRELEDKVEVARIQQQVHNYRYIIILYIKNRLYLYSRYKYTIINITVELVNLFIKYSLYCFTDIRYDL